MLTAAYTINGGGEPDTTLTSEVSFGTTSGSSDVDVGALDGNSDAPAVGMAIGAVEKGIVYFTAIKDEAQTITAGGTDVEKVTVYTSGTVDGEGADGETAVIAVETGDLVFEGGEREFTLTVSEEGALPRTVNVTLNVTPNLTGAAVFTVAETGELTRVPAENIKEYTGIDTNTNDPKFSDQTGTKLIDALVWIDQSGDPGAEYLVRVEKDESIPPVALSGTSESAGKIRLRGYGEERKITFDGTTLCTNGYRNKTSGISSSLYYVIAFYYKDIQLEKNITVDGAGIPVITASSGTPRYLIYIEQSTFTMEEGSKVTNYTTDMDSISGAPLINLKNTTKASDNKTYFVMKGGEVSGYNNTVCATAGPIYFSKMWPHTFVKTGGSIINNLANSAAANCVIFIKTVNTLTIEEGQPYDYPSE